jgi:hypothetical protein
MCGSTTQQLERKFAPTAKDIHNKPKGDQSRCFMAGWSGQAFKTCACERPITTRRQTVDAAEKLAKTIIANYDNPLQNSTIDVPPHVEALLQSLGATTSDSGGKVTYYGADPITPDRCHTAPSVPSHSQPRRS